MYKLYEYVRLRELVRACVRACARLYARVRECVWGWGCARECVRVCALVCEGLCAYVRAYLLFTFDIWAQFFKKTKSAQTRLNAHRDLRTRDYNRVVLFYDTDTRAHIKYSSKK